MNFNSQLFFSFSSLATSLYYYLTHVQGVGRRSPGSCLTCLLTCGVWVFVYVPPA